jgi:hypothetical protein
MDAKHYRKHCIITAFLSYSLFARFILFYFERERVHDFIK